MKVAGFKKQAQNFRRQTPRGWAILNVQKSRWNDRDEIAFTINLAIRYERIHRLNYPSAAYMWDRPPTYPECEWQERIGRLLDPPHDHWSRIIDDRTADRAILELGPLLLQAITLLDNRLNDVSAELAIARELYVGKALPLLTGS